MDPGFYYIMILFAGTGILAVIFGKLRGRHTKKILSKKKKLESLT